MRTRSDVLIATLVRTLITALVQASLLLGIPSAIISQYRATVTVDAGRAINVFDPNEALGAGIDGHDRGEIGRLLSPDNIGQMRSVGFKPVTYRLRTDLANDAWHWNPRGTWSDAAASQGYWTSDDNSTNDISLANGYLLPRRGNTIDQADNVGYSRIDDGNTGSFWKSNPYLDRAFTHDDNAQHPQWVVIDLGRELDVNAIRIAWGLPFAVKYRVQYGTVIDPSDIAQDPPGLWHDFEHGSVATSVGGEILTRLSPRPVMTRFVRVLMEQGSYTAPDGAKDPRDTFGFAIRELYLGHIDESGQFIDEMRHETDVKAQTTVYVSSTDPWHRSTDIDLDTEQIGFDRLEKSGLANNEPLLVPVGVLYDTPENAAAEIGYLVKRGYKIAGVEIGEEPDGQYMSPEDYGALYIQWAAAIHKVAPNVPLGGPSFQEVQPDTRQGKFTLGNAVWLERVLDYLKRRDHASDFAFFSFEWYPFDDVCKPTGPQIAENTLKLRASLDAFRRHGLRPDMPLIMSEYGYSAFSTAAEDDIEGALFNADTIGAFLELGGKRAYLYGYEPDKVERDFPCTAGNNMLFVMDDKGRIAYKTATYFGAKMAMEEWLQPTGGEHNLYSCETEPKSAGPGMIAAYAVRRPDGKWSLMLINKDPINTWQVAIRSKGTDELFAGGADMYQFSGKDYKWDAALGRPEKSGPPEHTELSGDNAREIQLPPYSMTVLRGNTK